MRHWSKYFDASRIGAKVVGRAEPAAESLATTNSHKGHGGKKGYGIVSGRAQSGFIAIRTCHGSEKTLAIAWDAFVVSIALRRTCVPAQVSLQRSTFPMRPIAPIQFALRVDIFAVELAVRVVASGTGGSVVIARAETNELVGEGVASVADDSIVEEDITIY